MVAGLHGSRLLDRLIVMGLPHLGVGLTNIDGAQRAKSSYVLQFQVRLAHARVRTCLFAQGVFFFGGGGLPHLRVSLTNIDGAQRAKSSYVLQFQVRCVCLRVCGGERVHKPGCLEVSSLRQRHTSLKHACTYL